MPENEELEEFGILDTLGKPGLKEYGGQGRRGVVKAT